MNKKIRAIACIILVAIISGCTESNMKDFIEKQNDKFIQSKSDYMYYDSRAIWCKWVDKDYFSNDEILALALQYSELTGRARSERSKASDYRNSIEPAYRYNSRGEEHARAAERNAHQIDSLAEITKHEILELLKTADIPETPKGLWIVHTLQYKEYLGSKAWVGPYQKDFLYLLKDNGKDVIQSREIYNSAYLFQDFQNITGAKYESHIIK